MSLWDSAISTRPSAPPTSRSRQHEKSGRSCNPYSSLNDDNQGNGAGSLAESLLGAEQELVSNNPAEAALLQKISGVRLVRLMSC